MGDIIFDVKYKPLIFSEEYRLRYCFDFTSYLFQTNARTLQVTTMEPNSKLNILEQDIVDHLSQRKEQELVRILEHPDPDIYHSLMLDGHELLDMSDLVFMKFILEPDKCLAKLDCLLGVALSRLRESAGPEKQAAWGPPKAQLHLRVRSLPDLPEFRRLCVPRSEDIGSVISLAGTVTKTGQAKMLTTRKTVSCTRCRHTFHVLADFEQGRRGDETIRSVIATFESSFNKSFKQPANGNTGTF